jgi:aminoglycoside phosphotransferase (APT) family kinase protein
VAGRLHPIDGFSERLGEYIEAIIGQPAKLDDLERLAGGISRETWRFDVDMSDGREERFVLRLDRPGGNTPETLEREQEFQVMEAAFAAGIAVPRPRWYCLEPNILGENFLIMDYIEGISAGEQIARLPQLAEARRLLPEQMAQQLARIHALDASKIPFLTRSGASPAQQALAHIRTLITKLGLRNPALFYGLRWAEQHMPSTELVTIVHGDYRLGNFLVGTRGLHSILDWESCHLGDPLEDVAWACLREWRYGNGKLALGGIADREVFISAYEAASGRIIDRRALDFWSILGNLRWAVMCLWLSARGPKADIEWVKLGRHSAELQYEMLRLLGELEMDADV